MIAATSLLVLAALFGAAQDEEPTAAPRRGIDGIGGLQTVSRIRFAPDPLRDVEPPEHVLEAIYAFPDRARWRLHAADGDAMARALYFRFGERAWSLPERQRSSIAYDPDERDAVVLQMEVRRAVLHYPHGFAWERTSATERVAVVRRSSPADRPVVGRLVAELEDDQLVRIRSFDGDGEEADAFEVLEVQERRGRSWPRELRLSHGGEPVWTETIVELATDARYIDRFFQPPDRRTGTVQIVGGRQILQISLVPVTFRRRPLPGESDWSSALALAADWIAEAAQELPLDLVPTFELDAEARPTAVVLRLEEARADPPDGWTTRWDRPGLGVALGPLDGLDARFVELLRRTAPADLRGGTAYCRIHDVPARSDVRVYLPLEAPDGR